MALFAFRLVKWARRRWFLWTHIIGGGESRTADLSLKQESHPRPAATAPGFHIWISDLATGSYRFGRRDVDAQLED
jgi:hypothetical protein